MHNWFVTWKKKKEIVWNLNFWENWVLNLGFVKIISSHTHAFFFIIFQCFEERLHQILLIFKISFFFLQFRSIKSVFRSIKIAIKNFSESLSVSIDWNYFSINRISWISFFLNSVFNPFKTLFQKFFQLFSLSPTRQSKIIQFLSFSSESFARFSSPKAGKSILPFLLHFISCLHA